MTIIEHDFINFLIEIGYAQHTANVYNWKLNKFAKENGYTNLIELADDVFILLNEHNNKELFTKNIEFDEKLLQEIHTYKQILILFNSFLFDIEFQRKFIVAHSLPKGYFGLLSTNETYIPGVRSRTFIDRDTNGTTNKQYFSIAEVVSALHVDEKTLKRWDDKDKEGKLKEHFPHRYKGNEKGDIDLNPPTTKVGIYNFYYYRLDELNDFLEYQFKYCKGQKREQYLSDADIRKSKKKNR